MSTHPRLYPRNLPAMMAGAVGVVLPAGALAWWAPAASSSFLFPVSLTGLAGTVGAGLFMAGTGARRHSLVLGAAGLSGSLALMAAALVPTSGWAGHVALVALFIAALGIANVILILSSAMSWRFRSATVGLLGALLAGTGMGWLVAHTVGSGTAGLGTAPGVLATVAAIGIMSFGLGSIAIAWRDDEEHGHLGPVWFPPVLGIGVVTISLLEWPALAAAHPAFPALSLALGVLVSLFLTLFVWFVHRQRETTIEVERINEALIEHLAERKRVERALVLAKEQAESANLAKSRFLATMSHELRTPLNSVVGFTNVLLKNKRGTLVAKDLGYLGRISDNAGHLLEIIDGILDLARIEADRLDLTDEAVHLDQLIPRVVKQLEGEVGSRAIALRSHVPSGLHPVTIDPGRLRQVLINLIGNALKFTERGTVLVSVRADAEDRPTAIEVADSGTGIPPDRLAVIFEPFQQGDDSTERKHGGTGLGLAISRTLLLAMGCSIGVESEVGTGSTFVIRFPS